MAERVWRELDQAGLDAQLNLRARWPEHPEIFARWAETSAAARRSLACTLDVAYGPTALQTLDFFPAGSEAPLLVFIHGGYWQFLDKSEHSYLAPPFVAAGIAVASLNYDLAPGVSITTIVEQIDRALAFIGREARRLGCDPRRIHLAGHSAGGHLAALAMIREGLRAADGGPPPLVQSGCAVSGVYDLAPLRRSYHQANLKITEREVAELSPLRCQPARLRPLKLAVGGEETEEFLRQQRAFAQQAEALSLPVTAMELPGRNHFTVLDALGETEQPLHRQLRDAILVR